MAKKLNAPRIDTKLPAQKVTQIKIPYRLPNSVSFADFNNIRILIKNVLSGTKIQETTTLNYCQSNEQYPNYYNAIGTLSTEQNETLIEGECYKVQLAFAQDNTIGYYSDVGIIKCVSAPELEFTNKQTGGPSIIYSVAQTAGDQISSYYWKLYQNNQLIEVSDIFYGKEETRFYWTPEFNSYKTGANVRIEFCYTTINFYQDCIMQDFIYENSLISNKIETFGIEALYNPSRAAIEVWTIIMSSSLGHYTLYRQDDKTNNWYKIDNCDFSDKGQQVSLLCLDSTIEHGVSYRYAVAQSGQFFEQTTDWIKADLEHIFLSDDEKQLCIKLNPSISAFKNIIQEQKIETIGGQFPYFFRNGNIKYREIPISGLISYWMNEDEGMDQALQNKYEIINKTYKRGDIDRDGDVSISDVTELQNILSGKAQAFYINADVSQDGRVSIDDTTKLQEILSGIIEKDKDNRLATPSNEPYVPNSRTTQLTADNVKKEKDFKLEVEAWLQNGKPKLFRSSTEGNYIIRLMNISLSPNTQLGRMLHTFSATGYEVAEFLPKELRKHKFFYVNKEYSVPVVSNTTISKGDSWEWYYESFDGEYKWPDGWAIGKNINKNVQINNAPFSLEPQWSDSKTSIPNIANPNALFRKALYIPNINELSNIKIAVRYDENLIVKFNGVEVLNEQGYYDNGYKEFYIGIKNLATGINWISASINNSTGGMGFDMSVTPIYKIQ